MNTHPQLTERIRYYRKLHSLTQEQLAAAVGVEPLHISNIERGKKGVSIDLMLRLCAIFGVTLDDLLPVELKPDTGQESAYIDDILDALVRLDIAQLGIVKTMVCALVD